MAEPLIDSPSPRVFQNNGYASALTHATPIHSAQNSLHSLRSSTSSRTPLHTLSLHEYRKLQRTPTPLSQTPPGKLLRRKPAAIHLKEDERTAGDAAKSNSAAPLLSRPLHFSLSLQRRAGYQPLPPSPPHCSEYFEFTDKPCESRIAEPTDFGGEAAPFAVNSVGGFHKETQKVGQWKTIKKLPRPRPRHPRSPLPSAQFPPCAFVTPLSPSYSITTPITENTRSISAPTTTSTVSLSRFPQPPHSTRFESPSSFPFEGNTLPRLDTSFTTALVTPPATPAVIHYRGTSFDLVNPHDSLLLHDIETPCKDLDSVEGSPVQRIEDFTIELNMAPRKRVYTDFGAAWNSIRRRPDEPDESDHPYTQLPPPPRAVISPSSPDLQSSDVADRASTALLSSKGPGTQRESRFSFRDFRPVKQLSRTFTRKREKASEPTEEQAHGQELQEFPPIRAGTAHEEEHGSTYEPITSLTYAGFESTPRMRSIVPDDPSCVGGSNTRASAAESLYPASSLYSNEGPIPGHYSRRTTNPFTLEDEGSMDPFRHPNTYSVANPIPSAEYLSGREETGYSSEDISQTDHPDTLTNIVDQYEGTHSAMSGRASQSLTMGGPSTLRHVVLAQDVSTDSSLSSVNLPGQVRQGRGRKPTVSHTPDPQTPRVASLESPFEYDDIINSLNQSSASQSAFPRQQLEPSSSYSRTDPGSAIPRQQLQPSSSCSRADPGSAVPRQYLEPSSPYSPSDSHRTPTPREALDEAERIFNEAESSNAIPAMWRQSSGGRLMKKHSTAADGNENDWETVGDKSRASAFYDDSIADFSSDSGDERDEHGMFKSKGNTAPSGHRIGGLSSRQTTHNLGASRGTLLREATTPTIGSQPAARQRSDPWVLEYEATREYLSSGPSDEVIYHDDASSQLLTPEIADSHQASAETTLEQQDLREGRETSGYSAGTELLHYSPLHESYNSAVARHRKDSYRKLTGLEPEDNLVGTLGGPSTYDMGSGAVDNSDAGEESSSTGVKRSRPVGFVSPEFYTDPQRTSSKVVIQGESYPGPGPVERSESEYSLPSPARRALIPRDPRGSRTKVVIPSGSQPSAGSSHGHRRSAVTGQTKLREMMLAPATGSSTRSVRSVQSAHSDQSRVTRFTDIMRLDAPSLRAPSSVNTNAPLTRPSNIPGHRQDSPHLRAVGREPTADDRADRSRISWTIFALFCLLPPLLILYRWLGDSLVAWVSRGRFNVATINSKRAALYVGLPLNIVVILAIMIPILITMARA